MSSKIPKITKWIEVNPKTQLKKGAKAKKVDMDKLMPFTRKISGYVETNFTGGSKFVNGDTLLARITPCLENGKTAYVDILEENEVSFGSTEFIVLRAKKDTTYPLFVYYLAISHSFRDKAISFMSGTSGRQRVDTQALANLEISLPPLEEQKRIAEMLGAFDDKIELLQKQNKTLEEMAKAIFKSWFVDFDIVKAKQKGEKKEDIIRNYHLTEELYNLFPSSFVDSSLGPIPTGWEVKTIQDVSKISSGKRPNSTQEQKSEFYNIAVYGGNGIKWWTKDPLYNTPIIITGRVGTLGQVYRIYDPVWVSDNALVFETISENFEYLFYSLKNIDFSSFNRGSTQPLITQGDIKNICLVYSKEIIKEFHNIVVKYEKKILLNNKQIQTLTELRDTLLPRLISGKIKV